METFEQASIVFRLSDEMRKRGSWAGETHIQKAMYFLQRLLQLPTNFDFILYKHGPFSFDLRSLLSLMEAENLICWQPRSYPYGPSLQPGSDYTYLERHYAAIADMHSAAIEFITDRLASKDVKTLERLATALYVSLEGGAPASRPFRLNILKPHVPVDQARQAIEELDMLVREASQRGLATSLTAIQ